MSEVANITEAQSAPAAMNGLPVSEIQAELDRILKSRVFVHSHRIRRFLQFVVEECLMGRQHRLKEYLIGLEVFNRQDDFDPRVDSIVRVEARRLRTKIEEYYLKEGRENEIRIELRKGSYVPIFEQRRPGMQGGYSAYQLPQRRSLAIKPVITVEGNSPLVEEIPKKLSQALLKGGYFKVMADGNGTANSPNGSSSHSNGHVKADYILESRLERRGDAFEVLLQLMSVGDGAYIWSDSGNPDDIEHLAGSLNRAMITSTVRPDNGRTRTRSSQRESFEDYLEGRFQWKLGTPASFEKSAALFRKAVAAEPTYAAAWASLAEASIVSSLFGSVDPREACSAIQDAASKAASLDASLPEAHVALASVKSLVDWDWAAGERDFQHAIQLDPRDPMAHLAYAIQLACRGMLKPALMEAECALELDPASLPVNFVLGWLLSISRRYDEAISQHRMVSRLAPDFALSYLGLGWAHLGKGQWGEALADFTNAANLLRSRTMLAGCLGHCHAKLNERSEALGLLAQLTSPSPGRYSSPVGVAAIYAGLGQTGEALTALEQAVDYRDCSLPIQIMNPEFDSLRDDPRFVALLERIGLAQSRSGSGLYSSTHKLSA